MGIRYDQMSSQFLLPKVQKLADRGVFVCVDAGSGPRSNRQGHWRYVKPTEPGAAAKVDAQRRPQRARQAVSEAVQGTGKKLGAGAKEVQAIIDACARQLGSDKVKKAGNQHFAIYHPDAPGGRVMIASTPNSAGLIKDKAKLRKLGIVGI